MYTNNGGKNVIVKGAKARSTPQSFILLLFLPIYNMLLNAQCLKVRKEKQKVLFRGKFSNSICALI